MSLENLKARIYYKPSHIKPEWYLGVIFLIVGIIGILLEIFLEAELIDLGSIGLGLIAGSLIGFGSYFYKRQKGYITIKNGCIYKHHLFAKKLKLEDLEYFEKFPGPSIYLLQTSDSNFYIHTDKIEKESLKELEGFLDKLNLQYQDSINNRSRKGY
jgi:hypothetical protein